MEDLALTVARLLKGDSASQQLQHFCVQAMCCQGRQRSVCIEEIYAPLVSAWFGPLSEGVPSITRWHTFGPSLSEQAGGMLCRMILRVPSACCSLKEWPCPTGSRVAHVLSLEVFEKDLNSNEGTFFLKT